MELPRTLRRSTLPHSLRCSPVPKSAIEEMKELTASEARDGANGLALALALGEVTKALERVANRLDKTEVKMDDMHDRLIRIEASSASDLAKENKQRIDLLEREVSSWKTRFITAGVILTAAWAVLGRAVENFFAKVF